MPRLTGPLMSLDASGTIGKAINYRRTKHGTVGRVHSQPSGDPSAKQLTIRAQNKQVAQEWANVSNEDRLTWKPLSDEKRYSLFNAFFVFNFARVHEGKTITHTYPPGPDFPQPDFIAVAGDPLPTPDYTGDYFEEGTHDGHPLYVRHGTVTTYLFHLINHWLICDTLDLSSGNDFNHEIEEIEGSYGGGDNADGEIIVSAP